MTTDLSIDIIGAIDIQTIIQRILKFYKNGTKKTRLKEKNYSILTIFLFIQPSCLSFLRIFYSFHFTL